MSEKKDYKYDPSDWDESKSVRVEPKIGLRSDMLANLRQKGGRIFLKVVQLIALAGFSWSLVAHAGSIFGIALVPNLFILHMGIFAVWIPTVLLVIPLSSGAPNKHLWKAALRGCPNWMKYAMYCIFGYGLLNFFVLVGSKESGGFAQSAANDIRLFSGHWMIFYFAALSVMTSALKVKNLADPECPVCKSKESPFANFCSNCGRKLELE